MTIAKFRNPKNGEVYDVKKSDGYWSAFCWDYECDKDCKIKKEVSGESCTNWILNNPKKAAELMGYELIRYEENSDTVNHPKHYQGKYECIDEMIELFGVEAVKAFCRCNVYKYRYRAEKKGHEEDIAKAEWYMGKLMELEGGK